MVYTYIFFKESCCDGSFHILWTPSHRHTSIGQLTETHNVWTLDAVSTNDFSLIIVFYVLREKCVRITKKKDDRKKNERLTIYYSQRYWLDIDVIRWMHYIFGVLGASLFSKSYGGLYSTQHATALQNEVALSFTNLRGPRNTTVSSTFC